MKKTKEQVLESEGGDVEAVAKTEGAAKAEAEAAAKAKAAEEARVKHEKLVGDVRGRLGEQRLTALGEQPPALAAGGMDAVLQASCTEAAGHPQPVMFAAVRVIQICGSRPKKEDLAE